MTLAEALASRVDDLPWSSRQSGCAVVYSSRTREPVWGAFGAPNSSNGLGLGMRAVEDVSGDGLPDLVVSDAEAAYVFAGPGRPAVGGDER